MSFLIECNIIRTLEENTSSTLDLTQSHAFNWVWRCISKHTSHNISLERKISHSFTLLLILVELSIKLILMSMSFFNLILTIFMARDLLCLMHSVSFRCQQGARLWVEDWGASERKLFFTPIMKFPNYRARHFWDVLTWGAQW